MNLKLLKLLIFITKSFVYLLFCCNISYAITLEDALEAALKNNSELKLERSRFETVTTQKDEAMSDFLPDVKAIYQIGRQKNDASNIDRGELDDSNTQDLKQLSLTQPIFSGLTGVNKLKEAQFNIKGAKYEYISKKNDILLETIQFYMNLCFAKEAFDLKSKNEKYTKKLLKLVKQRNRLGQVGGNDVIFYQSKLFNSNLETITAQKELFKARQDFENNIGFEIEFLSMPEIDQTKIINDSAKLIDLALLNNVNLKQYQFKIKAANAVLKQSKGAFSPTAELTASISQQENVAFLDNNDLNSESINLNFTIPIYQKGTEYNGLDKSRKDLTFARRELALNRELVIKDIKQTYEEYMFYADLIKNNQILVNLTKDKIQRLKQQSKLGGGDVIELLSTQIELNQILEQKMDHEVNYVMSYYKLLALTGDLWSLDLE